ncbi:MAG: FixH family protein [Helicobacteraceae bacterium]|jgi:hypothetical protein|nr:FixH family protein [Helicobacteraceae bacterium]
MQYVIKGVKAYFIALISCAFLQEARAAEAIVKVASLPDPIVVNRFYEWDLAVTDRGGGEAAGLSFQIRGRMPEHAHGLPVSPKIVEKRPGSYQIKGLSFNMPGRWIIEILHNGAIALRQELMVEL